MQEVDTLLIGIDEARKLREIADLSGVSMQAWVEAKINAAYVMATNHKVGSIMESHCTSCGVTLTGYMLGLGLTQCPSCTQGL